ncbi:spore germination protein [Halalkalibacter urbisdiaboli]|uniref:spore germination protein n=1 Tax=Halalkalibacter urbisdiaboli TaxID=1960589 RepID=UPI001FDA4E92|nr:spore germination protein [Halalkalibacter urbisdiaboli]
MRIYKQIMKAKRAKQKMNTPNDLLERGEPSKELSHFLVDNEATFNVIFAENFDYYHKRVYVGGNDGLILYLKSMVDTKSVSEYLMETLAEAYQGKKTIHSEEDVQRFQKKIFPSSDYALVQYEHEVVWYVLSGYCVILIEGVSKGLAINSTTNEKRAIEQSNTQTIIRGPKDSFTEALPTNISLIRRKIKNPHLICEKVIVGSDTQTAVCITYLKNIADPKIVEEVKKRINEIDIHGIFDSGNIEELINDDMYSPFPTIYHTDRPDTTSTKLIDGKIAIVVDGSPFVLIMPVVLNDFFQVSEDYYQGIFIGSFTRSIRYLSFMIALILPSMYIGLTTFHQQLIPTNLAFNLQAQREGVPFPAVVELLMMEITFEILREAGVRMPRAVGQAISIVGTLVIGQAAVEAGVVSSFLVIVVALTAMAGFVSPIYSFANSARLLRFGLILITAVLGLYGTLLGIIMILAHLASLRSFSVPYLAPMGPFILEDQTDTLLRLPLKMLNRKPSYLSKRATDEQRKADSKEGGKS